MASSGIVRLAGLGLGRLIVLAMLVFMAHRLGVEQFGRYGFIVAYLALFRLVGSLGLTPVLVKEFSLVHPDERARLMGTSLTIKLVLTLLASATTVALAPLVSQSPQLVASIGIASLSLVSVFGYAHQAFFQAGYRLQIVTLGETVNVLVWAGLGTLALLLRTGLNGVLWALVAANLAELATLLVVGRNTFPLRLRFNVDLAGRLTLAALPLAVMGAFNVVLLQLDVVMLHAFRTDVEVGWYAAASKLSDPWLMVSMAFTAAVFPRFCRWYSQEPSRFTTAYRLSYKYLLSFILPVATGGILLATPLTVAIFGSPYQPAASALIILLVTLVFVFLEMFTTYLLLASNQQGWAAAFTIGAGLINIAANLALIPRFGYIGAALASLAAYVGYFVLQALAPSTRRLSLALLPAAVRPILACLAMAAALALPLRGHFLVAVLVSPIVYLTALWMIRGIRISDFTVFADGSPLIARTSLPEGHEVTSAG